MQASTINEARELKFQAEKDIQLFIKRTMDDFEQRTGIKEWGLNVKVSPVVIEDDFQWNEIFVYITAKI